MCTSVFNNVDKLHFVASKSTQLNTFNELPVSGSRAFAITITFVLSALI